MCIKIRNSKITKWYLIYSVFRYRKCIWYNMAWWDTVNIMGKLYLWRIIWDLHLEIDSECWLRTKLRQERWFRFPIVNFPFIGSDIPADYLFIYISVYPIFPSSWFRSWFPWQRVATNREATEPSIPSG